MRAGHWNLHPLTIPAKFAGIGSRELELSVHPARAAAPGEEPPSANFKFEQESLCLDDTAILSMSEVNQVIQILRAEPLFSSFSSKVGVWLVLAEVFCGAGPLGISLYYTTLYGEPIIQRHLPRV